MPDFWFVCYLLYIIFIWFSSGTRNCISSNLYLLVLEHNISRLSASRSTVTAKSTYYRSQVSGVNFTLALYPGTSQTGLLNYIYPIGVYARGRKRSHALEMCTLPWTGSTQETEPDVMRGSERLTLSLAEVRSGRVGPQLYHSNLVYR